MLKTWKKLSSKVISRNKYWKYILEEFEIDGKHRGEYHYIHTGGSTMIIPITSSGKLLLVNQYRYLNRKESLEFPCGSIQSEITPEENALKELREETGFSAREIEYVGEYSPYSGVSDEMCSVFIAKNLFPSPLPSDFTEDFELLEVSPQEFEKMALSGELWDGMTLAAWTMSKIKIEELIRK